MSDVDSKKEWGFIISEVHNKKIKKIKREILFLLQILLAKKELENYFTLKKIYCAE
jgi:hypothetical protein